MRNSFVEENYDEVLSAFHECAIDPVVHWNSAVDMGELDDGSTQLVVTSPPYPMIEMWDELFEDALDVEEGWIENNPHTAFSTIHRYLTQIWSECYRVLEEGGIMAVNIGDATRSFDSFQCWPNHSEIQSRCRSIGFDSLIPIHWKKPTNGPNAFLGSGMLPPNGYVTLDCEYILLFRKGDLRSFEPHHPLRYASQYEKNQRDEWFSQTWRLNGHDNGSEFAQYPSDIPRRLIQMFSVMGDTVVDPFMGTGTTVKTARELGRQGVGYEINRDELENQVDEKVFNNDYPTREELLQ